jgi:Zn-dependent protease with chaperone function
VRDAQEVPQQLELKTQECPQCGAQIPVYRDYVTWCDKCEWNIQPLSVEEKPPNVFESLYASIGKRLSKRLFDELARTKSLEPTLTVSKVLAFVIAALVHAFTLLLAVLGILLLATQWPNIMGLAWGALFLGIAWALRPSLGKLDDIVEYLPRDQYPALYGLVDEVARALGSPSVDIIIADEDFKAAFGQVGWRRRRVLFLGLPLFSILDAQERVSVLGHEIAHGLNGDPTRGFFTGNAVSSLIRWYYMLHPDRIWDPDSGLSILTMPGNLLLLGLSNIVRLWIYVLANLIWRDSQRAEYLADALGAEAAGTAAALSAMDKLHLGSSVYMTIHRVALNWRGQDMFAELRREAAEVPPRELERIRRVEQKENSRLDVTHPPTAFRIGLLKARPVREPRVVVSESRLEELERELAPVRKKIQEQLLGAYGNY